MIKVPINIKYTYVLRKEVKVSESESVYPAPRNSVQSTTSLQRICKIWKLENNLKKYILNC